MVAVAVAVGIARRGIAETGSLVFHSGAGAPVLANFLPLQHIVALHRGDIVACLEDHAQRVAGQPTPRNLNLISGGQRHDRHRSSLVPGAHGPRFLQVVIAAAQLQRSAGARIIAGFTDGFA